MVLSNFAYYSEFNFLFYKKYFLQSLISPWLLAIAVLSLCKLKSIIILFNQPTMVYGPSTQNILTLNLKGLKWLRII